MVNPSRVDDLPARRTAICDALAQADWPAPAWFETTADDCGTGQTRQAVADGAEVVFVLGGDGTVMAAVAALTEDAARGRAALAVLPAGTGNLLARNLGLPDDAAAGVRLATSGARRCIDVCRLVGEDDGRPFVVMAGMGFDAAMVDAVPVELKKRLGWPAYVVAAARQLTRPGFPVTVTVDGGAPVRHRVRSVLVGNVGRLQGGVRLLADAAPDDGVLDVALLVPRGVPGWLRLGVGLLLHRRRPAGLHVLTGRRVEITTDRPQPRELDGDLVEPGRSLVVEVDPGALTLCVPVEGRAGDLEHSDARAAA